MDSNHVRDLMEAYISIYAENQEVEQLDEEMTISHPFRTGIPGPRIPPARTLPPPPTSGKPTVKKPSPTPTKPNIIQGLVQRLNQSFDLFDIIKGHLLDEGFADTEEAALAIMSNMSEEWREEILDEAATILSVTSSDGKKRYKSPKYSDSEIENIRRTAHKQKRLKQLHRTPGSDERNSQREMENDERRRKIEKNHPAYIMNAIKGDPDLNNDYYYYKHVRTDHAARRRRASGR